MTLFLATVIVLSLLRAGNYLSRTAENNTVMEDWALICNASINIGVAIWAIVLLQGGAA